VRRLVVVVPELLSLDEPVLDRGLPSISLLAERSILYRLAQLEPVETPEARLLGLRPSEAELRQGPLTISALGADPPPRSLHFHLSLASLYEDVIRQPEPGPGEEEVRTIVEVATKLNTRLLTLVAGSGVDHGLVWEALGDLETDPISSVVGCPIHEHLPRGDGEPMLRQYIDDSVNLLGELDLNRRRIDEGQMPLNLLWPWGHGERGPIPNLALRRGGPATVISSSLRLAGLTRLAGYRHLDVAWLGSGLQTRLREAAARLLDESNAVLVLHSLETFRAAGELDEAAYFARQLDSELLAPVLAQAADEPVRLLFAAPSSNHDGLAVQFDSKSPGDSIYPFDERSIDEERLPRIDLESVIAATLTVETE